MNETDYSEICKLLGFDASSKFVEITKNGSVGFTCGKPDEIRALYHASVTNGLRPSRELLRAMRVIDCHFRHRKSWPETSPMSTGAKRGKLPRRR